jgi:hypothetical protein
MPRLNQGGGSAAAVRDAVGLLDAAGSAESVFARIAADVHRHRGAWADLKNTGARARAMGGEAISTLSPAARLALEMASHEEQERRALEGELRELELAWQRAEEIAAIADDLLLPQGVGTKLDQLRASSGRSSARAGAPSNPTNDSGAASNS